MKVGDRVRVKYATYACSESQVSMIGEVVDCTSSPPRMEGAILVKAGPEQQWHRPEALAVVPEIKMLGGVLSSKGVTEALTGPLDNWGTYCQEHYLPYSPQRRCVLPHPSERPESKQAAIKVRYVDVKGVSCVEIIGFKNILMEHELPKEYFKGRLHFDLRKSAGSFTYRSTFSGLDYQDRVATVGTPFIALDIPVPIEGFNYIHGLYIYQGDVLRQDTFGTVMVWLKRAGSRLAKINRKKREAEEVKKQEVCSDCGFSHAPNLLPHYIHPALRPDNPKEEWVSI
jgi:hypothetical protein